MIPAATVPTAEARLAIPPAISVTDAVANVAAATQLVLGLERSDLALIAAGLADRLHQPARRELYPRSLDLVAGARELGAIGATISGAGPSRDVLVLLAGHRQGARGPPPRRWATGPR